MIFALNFRDTAGGDFHYFEVNVEVDEDLYPTGIVNVTWKRSTPLEPEIDDVVLGTVEWSE